MVRRNFIKKLSFLFILFFLVGCNAKQNNEVQDIKKESKFFAFQKTNKIKSLNRINSIEKDKLCLKQVFKELEITLDTSDNYSMIESEFESWQTPRKIFYDISKYNLSTELENKLDSFLENNNPETLKIVLLNNKKNNYLIFIGKSLGATGIGVRYNNYFIVNLNTSHFIQQDSISENPFSVFIDKNDNLNIVVLDENFRNVNAETENSFFYSLIKIDVKDNKAKGKKTKFICN